MRGIGLTLCMICLLGIGWLGLQFGYPQKALADSRCSQATLKGSYIFAANGWQIKNGQTTVFALAGRETYDGKGAVRGLATQSTNGAISGQVTYTGTYTIAQDCTGTLTEDIAGIVSHYNLYVSSEGDEFAFIQTDPGVISTNFERRVKDSESP